MKQKNLPLWPLAYGLARAGFILFTLVFLLLYLCCYSFLQAASYCESPIFWISVDLKKTWSFDLFLCDSFSSAVYHVLVFIYLCILFWATGTVADGWESNEVC